jgi:restriction system protein
MQALTHPYLLAVLAAGLGALLAWLATGTLRRDRSEARAGLLALCGMRWRDFAHVVEDLLRDRGYAGNNEERLPGDGGFDLMMTRGRSQYLIVCKNGAAHRVSAASVRDLASLVEHQGAEGAVLATTGSVDAEAKSVALNRRVELMHGQDFWRQVKPWTPHELRVEAETGAAKQVRQRGAISAGVALVAGVLVALLAPRPEASLVAPAPAPVVRAAPTAVETVVAGSAAPEPAARLSESELAMRRTNAALEVRGNPTVQQAIWSTQSTLVVTLRSTVTTIPDSLLDQLCAPLVQFEELRYSRLQVESPAKQSSGAPMVRWRQCR